MRNLAHCDHVRHGGAETKQDDVRLDQQGEARPEGDVRDLRIAVLPRDLDELHDRLDARHGQHCQEQHEQRPDDDARVIDGAGQRQRPSAQCRGGDVDHAAPHGAWPQEPAPRVALRRRLLVRRQVWPGGRFFEAVAERHRRSRRRRGVSGRRTWRRDRARRAAADAPPQNRHQVRDVAAGHQAVLPQVVDVPFPDRRQVAGLASSQRLHL
mmetsp:Transcript_85076/g.259918  ORF Transcript_85076/g.259918 Transcript_85076/m.259918 type:complete len:211 (+) Transcript_85076:1064-1696(+)